MDEDRSKTPPQIASVDNTLFEKGAVKIQAQIRDHALQLGFDAIGMCPAHLNLEVRQRLKQFIQAGFHGDMGWLGDRSAERSQPKSLWPEVQSVIVVGLSYAPEEDPRIVTKQSSVGAISVYARNRDYHDIIKGKLKHLAQFITSRYKAQVKVFVDTAPVMEKALAAKAGLGWQGKHTNLVSRSYGSWLLLGEIYTTLNISRSEEMTDHCGKCSKCLQACPTNAFVAPYQLDATRCISYLTIEHKGSIPLEFRKAIGNRIYGCDDCLAVCPWNKFASPTLHKQLVGRDDLTRPLLAELSTLDDAHFRTMFSGSPIKRIGRNRFIRNVLIAIGNSSEALLLPFAQALQADPDPIVAETATWAVTELTHLSS